MTYNVFGGTLSFTQSINQLSHLPSLIYCFSTAYNLSAPQILPTIDSSTDSADFTNCVIICRFVLLLSVVFSFHLFMFMHYTKLLLSAFDCRLYPIIYHSKPWLTDIDARHTQLHGRWCLVCNSLPAYLHSTSATL